jgi:hypothetical protein
MTFHMPDSWYEPPDPFECELDCEERGRDCDCEERARDEADAAREQHDVDRADAEKDDAR